MSNNNLLNYLKNTPLFSNFSQDNLTILAPYLEPKELQPKQVVLEQGGLNDCIFLVVKGEFDITVTLPGDKIQHVAMLGPSDFFGEVTMLSHGLVTAIVISQDKGLCYVLSQTNLNVLRATSPEVAHNIEFRIAILSRQRTYQVYEKMHDLLKAASSGKGKMLTLPFVPISSAKYIVCERSEINLTLLSGMESLAKLTQEEHDVLLSHIDVVKYERGYLIESGESQGKFLGFVYSGAIQVSVRGKENTIDKIEVVGPGGCFGFMSMLAEEKDEVAFLVREPAVVFQVNRAHLAAIHKENIPLWYKLSQHIFAKCAAYLFTVDRQLIRMESEFQDILK